MAERSQKDLKQARKTDLSGEAFLTYLYRALVSAIFSTAGTKGESLTYAEAEEILCNNGYSTEIGTQAAGLLKKIESARYGGLIMDAGVRSDLLSETKQVVRSLLR